MSRLQSLWKPAVLAIAAGAVLAAPTAAEPTKVTSIKGNKLHLFSETGKRVDSIDAAKIKPPLDIDAISPKGMFKVEIPGKGEFWILKAQSKTDEKVEANVQCQEITKSYASSRGFADCK